MPDELQRIHGVAVLVCAPDGQILRSERDAMDILGEALHPNASRRPVADGGLAEPSPRCSALAQCARRALHRRPPRELGWRHHG